MADPLLAEVAVSRAKVLDGIAHGFLGRIGGVSTGEVGGLNVGLGSGDDPEIIVQNRRRAVDAVAPGRQLATVYQVHSADCVIVNEAWPDEVRPQADALVTDQPGLVLGVLTADCAPVLFADRNAGVIGAAHAGWKGALGGITDATIAAMEKLGAHRERIVAAIGPCIAQASYEVDRTFYERFCRIAAENAAHFVSGAPEHWQFDLAGYVARRLTAAGIGQAERLDLDTYTASEGFFSYRGACHRGEPSYGRQISLIALG